MMSSTSASKLSVPASTNASSPREQTVGLKPTSLSPLRTNAAIFFSSSTIKTRMRNRFSLIAHGQDCGEFEKEISQAVADLGPTGGTALRRDERRGPRTLSAGAFAPIKFRDVKRARPSY